MVRFLYRLPRRHLRQRQEDFTIRVFDDLFDLLLNQLASKPRHFHNARRFCRKCGQFLSEVSDSTVLCDKCRTNTRHHKIESSTYPCNICGIRFSANLLENGTCRGCRSREDRSSQNQGCGETKVNTSISQMSLKQAYQTLRCDFNDSDEIIERRHRELAKEFHSDRLSLEASPEQIRYSNERFCRAQEAYEIIMISRKKGT
jgi:hypothetical protein